MSPAITLGNTIGAAFLGLVGSAILYGITTLQTFIYYLNFPLDHLWYRISVGSLWILDTLHIALSIHAVYTYLIDDFGLQAAQEIIVWSFKVLQIAINIVIIIIVQSLYAARIWSFGRHFNKLIPVLVAVLVAVGYVIGIVLAVKTYRIDSFLQLDTISWAIYASFATSTVIDFVIALVMCLYLQRSRSEFSATNSVIVSIMSYVIGSGLTTSACSTTALLTFALMPSTLVFLGIEFLLTKLYINSFMAMLNARRYVRSRRDGTESHAISDLSKNRSNHSERTGAPYSSRPVIHIETVITSENDHLDLKAKYPSPSKDPYEGFSSPSSGSGLYPTAV